MSKTAIVRLSAAMFVLGWLARFLPGIDVMFFMGAVLVLVWPELCSISGPLIAYFKHGRGPDVPPPTAPAV